MHEPKLDRQCDRQDPVKPVTERMTGALLCSTATGAGLDLSVTVVVSWPMRNVHMLYHGIDAETPNESSQTPTPLPST